MPDGTPGPGVGNSLIVQAEESDAGTVVPRLRAAGADLDRTILWGTDDCDEPLRLPSQLGRLHRAILDHAARLVVLDPIISFLDPNVMLNSDQGIRRVLSSLKRLAERLGCAILMIRHLNKRIGLQAL
jgi:RecA-family ATPase